MFKIREKKICFTHGYHEQELNKLKKSVVFLVAKKSHFT